MSVFKCMVLILTKNWISMGTFFAFKAQLHFYIHSIKDGYHKPGWVSNWVLVNLVRVFEIIILCGHELCPSVSIEFEEHKGKWWDIKRHYKLHSPTCLPLTSCSRVDFSHLKVRWVIWEDVNFLKKFIYMIDQYLYLLDQIRKSTVSQILRFAFLWSMYALWIVKKKKSLWMVPYLKMYSQISAFDETISIWFQIFI